MIGYQEQFTRKYAVAFLNIFSTALEKSHFDALEKLESFLLLHSNALFLMHLTGIDEQLKLNAVMGIVEKFGLGQLKPLVKLLIEDRRLNFLPQVIHKLKDQLLENLNVIEFEISSASFLNNDERKIVEDFLAAKTGKTIIAEYNVDPTLIAGIRINSGEYFWEHSIKQELAQLKSANFMN